MYKKNKSVRVQFIYLNCKKEANSINVFNGNKARRCAHTHRRTRDEFDEPVDKAINKQTSVTEEGRKIEKKLYAKFSLSLEDKKKNRITAFIQIKFFAEANKT